jgi:hypothetical protein
VPTRKEILKILTIVKKTCLPSGILGVGGWGLGVGGWGLGERGEGRGEKKADD